MKRPSTRLLLSLLAALVVLAPARPVLASTDALEMATRAWKSLSANRSKRQLRHNWERVITGLEQASRGHSACSWTQLALVRAAQATEELSTVSNVDEDRVAAVKRFAAAARSCPEGRLTDDAWLWAAALQDRLGDVEGQRDSLQKAVAVKGDLRQDAAAALAKLPPPPKKQDASLADATDRYERMKADRKLRFYRHNWVAAVRRFERVGDALAPSKDAAIAYMRGAKASEEVSRISKRDDDARKAIALYLKVADRCGKQTLVDDALLEAANLELNRFGDTQAARAHLERAVAFNGDMKKEAARLLATLPAPAKKPLPVVKKKAPPVEPAPEHAHDEDVLAGEPLSPDALVEATFGGEAMPLGEEGDLAALMQRVDALTEKRERKEMAAQVKELKQEALGGEWSISEQLGAKVRRIVLDAGHGGHDAGAIGPTGVKEKDVTLAIALKLARLLRTRGYEVVLTREDDRFLALEERTRVANEAHGDLFISIHANAHHKRSQGGIETYSLNVASDRFAMRLAARENASTERSVGDLQFLLADLAARANTADSDRLASLVQDNLVKKVRSEHGAVHNRGVKHALFYVLLGAKMPAILVETAFVSNKREEKWLASKTFQQNVATAMADGIDRFVERRNRLASVDR